MAEPSRRHVVVGLARARQGWFTDLARWSSGAVAPVDFVKCLTPEEARAVIAVGRRASLLLVDGGLPRWDRDLVETARDAGTPTVLVTDQRAHTDWEDLGCVAVLADRFGPDDLAEVLRRHAPDLDAEVGPRRIDLDAGAPGGRLIGVTGCGGSGVSTVAMLVAQGLADRPAPGSDRSNGSNGSGDTDGRRTVVLVDGARRSSQAAYHDVGDVIPGLPELVDLHRRDRVDPEELRALTFDIPERGYRLVLGQRRVRDWVALRPRALEAALDGLRRTHGVVVVDHDPDVDGEAETGSVDVEERHALARAVVNSADAVLVVARPGLHGVHALLRLIEELTGAGADPARLLPVFVPAPRSPADRAELMRAVHELGGGTGTGGSVPPPVFVPRIRRVEDLHRGVGRLPTAAAGRLAAAVDHLTLHAGRRQDPPPPRVRPGDLATALDLQGRRSDVA